MKAINFRVSLICIAFIFFVFVMGTATSVHAAPLSAPAVQDTVNLAIKGGQLSFAVGTPSSPVSTPLNNSMQNVSYTVPVVVTDATGTGDGWTLQLATNDEASSQSVGTPFVTGIVVKCAVNSTCSLPLNTVSYGSPISLGSATTPVFTAMQGTGMGTMLLSVQVSVDLPANVSLNAYSGNLAFALSGVQTS
jgi:hypothetical protein